MWLDYGGSGIQKRRNLLKNEMWQLLFLSVISILWDAFTGWRGWSVDYVMPVASLLVLSSMPVIAWVRHLEQEEYLFYIMQASAFGLIPLVLLLGGVVKIPYAPHFCV